MRTEGLALRAGIWAHVPVEGYLTQHQMSPLLPQERGHHRAVDAQPSSMDLAEVSPSLGLGMCGPWRQHTEVALVDPCQLEGRSPELRLPQAGTQEPL